MCLPACLYCCVCALLWSGLACVGPALPVLAWYIMYVCINVRMFVWMWMRVSACLPICLCDCQSLWQSTTLYGLVWTRMFWSGCASLSTDTSVCMYIYIFVCLYVCPYICVSPLGIVCIYVRMYVCMVWAGLVFSCMFVCLSVCMHGWMGGRMDVSLYLRFLCMYDCLLFSVCMYDCMYDCVCMYVCLYACECH